MKKYKLSLSIGGFSFVHATRYEQEGHWTKFYRHDSLVAEFATVTLRNIEDVTPPAENGGREGHTAA
jgi:hypothetical protein